jgi:hypothetical protein
VAGDVVAKVVQELGGLSGSFRLTLKQSVARFWARAADCVDRWWRGRQGLAGAGLTVSSNPPVLTQDGLKQSADDTWLCAAFCADR